MPRKRSRPTRRVRSVVPKKTRRIRKLAGQRPLTMVEHIAGYKGSIGTVANAVAQIYGLVNSEVKYLDTVLTANISTAGTAIATLTNIAEGDDIGQRNGRWVLAKSVQGKMTFNMNASATTSQVGWVLVMDKKASIGITGWTDIMATNDVNALINRNDSERFVILRRGIVNLSINGDRIKSQKFYIPLKGIHLKYNGTGATAYDQNNIFLVFISTEATNTVTLTGNCRFDYYDN